MSNFESFYGGRQGNSMVIVKRFDAIDASKDYVRTKYALKAIQNPDVFEIDENGQLIEQTPENVDLYAWKDIIKDGKHGVQKITGRIEKDLSDKTPEELLNYIVIPEEKEPVYKTGLYAKDTQTPYKLMVVNDSLIEKNGKNYADYFWMAILKDGKHGVKKSDGTLVSDISDLTPQQLEEYIIIPKEEAEGMVQCFKKGGETSSEVGYGEYVIIDTIEGLHQPENPDNGKIFRRGFNYADDENLNGAEYVGQIVGPRGGSAQLGITSISQMSSLKNNGYYTPTDGDLVPGMIPPHDEEPMKFNDAVEYAWENILDDYGNISSCEIGFRIPYFVPVMEFEPIEPYDGNGNRITSVEIDPYGEEVVEGAEHPFCRKWKVETLNGVHGQSIGEMCSIPSTIRIGSQLYNERTGSSLAEVTTEIEFVDANDFYNNYIKGTTVIDENSRVKVKDKEKYARVYDCYDFYIQYSLIDYDQKQEGTTTWNKIDCDVNGLLEIELVAPKWKLPAEIQNEYDNNNLSYPPVGHLIGLYREGSPALRATEEKYSYFSKLINQFEVNKWVDLGYARGETGGLRIFTRIDIPDDINLSISEYIAQELNTTPEPPEEKYGNKYRGWGILIYGYETNPHSLTDEKVGTIVSYDYYNELWVEVQDLSADFFQPSATIIIDSENSNHTPLNYSIIDYPNKDGVWLIKKLMTSPY